MSERNIVVIGGSAGAYEAVLQIVSGIPEGFEATIIFVVHMNAPYERVFVTDIRHACSLPVAYAVDGERVLPSRIYVAPGGRNTLVERGYIRVQASPREHTSYPSINALFRSAALAYGPRVIGIILSGLLTDGTAGLWEIKKRGGIAIVQSPDETSHPSMVNSALENVAVDYCVNVAEMVPLLERLVSEPLPSLALRGSQPPKVLIVEDEGIVAMNLQARLEELGYLVLSVVSSGEEAITAIQADRPDVVLMDIRLAGVIDGTEAAGAVWRWFHVPVVYLTAHGDEKTLMKVKETEPYGFVLKPFSIEQIHAAIQLALDRRDKESA